MSFQEWKLPKANISEISLNYKISQSPLNYDANGAHGSFLWVLKFHQVTSHNRLNKIAVNMVNGEPSGAAAIGPDTVRALMFFPCYAPSIFIWHPFSR